MRSPGSNGPLALAAAESGTNGKHVLLVDELQFRRIADADRRHAEQLLGFHDDFQRILDARPLDEQRDSMGEVGVDDLLGHLPEVMDLAAGDFQDFVVGPGCPPATRPRLPSRCPTTVGFCFTPTRKATTAKTNAKIMFMITPAEMMAIRWGTLFAR